MYTSSYNSSRIFTIGAHPPRAITKPEALTILRLPTHAPTLNVPGRCPPVNARSLDSILPEKEISQYSHLKPAAPDTGRWGTYSSTPMQRKHPMFASHDLSEDRYVPSYNSGVPFFISPDWGTSSPVFWRFHGWQAVSGQTRRPVQPKKSQTSPVDQRHCGRSYRLPKASETRICPVPNTLPPVYDSIIQRLSSTNSEAKWNLKKHPTTTTRPMALQKEYISQLTCYSYGKIISRVSALAVSPISL